MKSREDNHHIQGHTASWLQSCCASPACSLTGPLLSGVPFPELLGIQSEHPEDPSWAAFLVLGLPC
jgi:hypothetical protein